MNTEEGASQIVQITLEKEFPYRALSTSLIFGGEGLEIYARLCSGNLPPVSALSYLGLGTTRRVYLSGEESADGRAFVFFLDTPLTTTTSPTPGVFLLRSLGRLNFEQIMPCPYPQAKTVTVAMDDTSGGFVEFHVGVKSNTGTDFQRSGLNGGQSYGLQIGGGWVEGATDPASGTRFSLVALPDLSSVTTRAATAAAMVAAGATQFSRPEDVEWRRDLSSTVRQELVLVTSGDGTGPSRVWRLTFDNISMPELGGVVEVMAKVTATIPHYDNVAVSLVFFYYSDDGAD